jgi:phospholipase/lecithinase/hemolysin
MAIHWLRRAWLLAAAAVLLAGCGGGEDVTSQLTPGRVIVFGDAMADVGQTGARYTVNDGTLNNWPLYVADSYGHDVQPSNSGGFGYAWGNARVASKPDAAGNAATPTVREQVDAFLARTSPRADDLIILAAGTSDVIAQVQAVIEGRQASEAMQANVGQAGRELAEQVKRLVAAGAEHVVVSGPYNLGRSPWGRQTGRNEIMEAASSEFNEELLVALVDYGRTVLYVDMALFVNQLTASGAGQFRNANEVVCESTDPGPGIGTGTGQVNSRLCTPSTIRSDANYNDYLFADRVYLTARGNQRLGEYARDRIRNRW